MSDHPYFDAFVITMNVDRIKFDREMLDLMTQSIHALIGAMYRGSYDTDHLLNSEYKLVLGHQQPHVFRSDLMSVMASQMSKTPSILKGRISIGNASYDGPPDRQFRHELIHFCNSHIINLKVDEKDDTPPDRSNYATRLVINSLNPNLIMDIIPAKENPIRSFFEINDAILEIREDTMVIGFDSSTHVSASKVCTCSKCKLHALRTQLDYNNTRVYDPRRLYTMLTDV